MNNGLFGIQGRAGVTSSGGGTTVPIGGVIEMAPGSNLPTILEVDKQKFVQCNGTVPYSSDYDDLLTLGIGRTISQDMIGGPPCGTVSYGLNVNVYNHNTDLVEKWVIQRESTYLQPKLYGPASDTSFAMEEKAEFNYIGYGACYFISYSYELKKFYAVALKSEWGFDGTYRTNETRLFSSADGYSWVKENYYDSVTNQNSYYGQQNCISGKHMLFTYQTTSGSYPNLTTAFRYSVVNLETMQETLAQQQIGGFTLWSVIPVPTGFVLSYSWNPGTINYSAQFVSFNTYYTAYHNSTTIYNVRNPFFYAKGNLVCIDNAINGGSVYKYTRNPTLPMSGWTSCSGSNSGGLHRRTFFVDPSCSDIYLFDGGTTANLHSTDYGVTWSPVTTAVNSSSYVPVNIYDWSSPVILLRGGAYSSGNITSIYGDINLSEARYTAIGKINKILYYSGSYYAFTDDIILKSPDLRDWTAVYSYADNATFKTAKVLSGSLIAISSVGKCHYTNDGTTWNNGLITGFSNAINDIEFLPGSPGKFIVVGAGGTSLNYAKLSSNTFALTGWTTGYFIGNTVTLQSVTANSAGTLALITANVASGVSSGTWDGTTFTASATQLQYLTYSNLSLSVNGFYNSTSGAWYVSQGTVADSRKIYKTTDGSTLTDSGMTLSTKGQILDLVVRPSDGHFFALTYEGVTEFTNPNDLTQTVFHPVMTSTWCYFEKINCVDDKVYVSEHRNSYDSSLAMTCIHGATKKYLPPVVSDSNRISYVRYK